MANALAAGKVVDSKSLYRYCVKLEKAAVSQADLVLAVSKLDKQEFIRLYGKDPDLIEVIPNGADTANINPVSNRQKIQLKKALGLPQKHTVICLASNDKPPHQAGMDWIRRVARRLNDCTFLVVGGLFAAPEVSGNIIATGYVDSPVGYLQASDVSICPIQYGGGTKIKVLESLAAGLPTICFKETLLGTALCDEEHILVADKNEDSIIASIRRLSSNRGLKEHLVNEGRQIVCDKYNWMKISEKLDYFLRRIADQ